MEGLSFRGNCPHQGEVFLGLILHKLPGPGAPLEAALDQTCRHRATSLKTLPLPDEWSGEV